jgi:hypothetical protein
MLHTERVPFNQSTDDAFISRLERATFVSTRQDRSADNPRRRDEDIEILVRDVGLAGYLAVPSGAPGIVVFAHGSGSSRHSSRNRSVADVLNQAGLGTLLFDLLTPDGRSIGQTSSISDCLQAGLSM